MHEIFISYSSRHRDVTRELAASGASAQLPDAVVEQVFAAPQRQALLVDILKQGGIDGAPADQPMEIKRAIVAALIEQGIVQIGGGEEHD